MAAIYMYIEQLVLRAMSKTDRRKDVLLSYMCSTLWDMIRYDMY